MKPGALRQRFESSEFIRDLWPPALLRRSVDSFGPQSLFDDLSVWGRFNPIVSLQGVLTLSSLHTLPLLLMDTEPAIQRITVPLYNAGARDSDLEFEMGARAMSERDYEGAARHFALVTDGARMVRAQLLRTLALGLLGRQGDARQCLNSLGFNALSSVDAYSARWLARFLQSKQGQSGAVDDGRKVPTTAP